MATIKRKKQKTKIELPKLKMPGFGTFLFALVFIYILIRVVAYVNDSDPIIFTVEQSTYDTDFTATGLAVRSETVSNERHAGEWFSTSHERRLHKSEQSDKDVQKWIFGIQFW